MKLKYRNGSERFYARYKGYVPLVHKHLNMRAAADLASKLFQPAIEECHWNKPITESLYDARLGQVQERITKREERNDRI